MVNPKLTRKQNIALAEFEKLNRDRDYYTLPQTLKPANIKERDIAAAHAKLIQPISYEHFKAFIQALDDTFIEVSNEQIRALAEGNR